ncbi:MAG: hypothetical protein AB1746_03075 [Candidatus Zixiibacteriota bacterium]
MRKNLFWLYYIILSLFFLLRLLPFLIPGARLWGINHLLFLPSGYTIAYLTAFAVALVMPFIIKQVAAVKAADWFSISFYESKAKHYYSLGLIIIASLFFILFAAPTHFLGDGYTLLSNLSSDKGTFYKWSEKGITALLTGFQGILGGRNEQTALTAFRVVSIFSGLVSIWFFIRIAGIMTKDRFRQLLIFLSAFLSASLLLFFGYVENYPLLWPALAGFIYFGISYIKNGNGFIGAVIFLICGILVHLQFALMLPAMLFLLFSRGFGRKSYNRFKIYIWILIVTSGVAAIALFVHKLGNDLYFENIFLPLFKGKPIAPEYALISIPHLADILNQLILLSPAIILLLVAAFGNLKKILKEEVSIFLVLISAAGFLFLFAIDPKLGMPRDWDLFSLAALAPTLLLVSLLDKEHLASLSRLTFSLIVYLASAVIPYLVVNLDAGKSIAYFKYMSDLDRGKSMPGLITLRGYYSDRGNIAAGDSVNNVIQARFPDESKIQEAFAAIRRRDLNRARSIAASIRPDKFSANYHNFMSTLYMSSGEYRKALEESDKLIQLQKYNYKYYMARTYTFLALRQSDQAIESIREAYKYNNSSPEVLELLSNIFLNSARPDSALFYAERMIQTDSANVSGYYWLAKINFQLGRIAQARNNAALYFSNGARDPMYNSRSSELNQLLQNK